MFTTCAPTQQRHLTIYFVSVIRVHALVHDIHAYKSSKLNDSKMHSGENMGARGPCRMSLEGIFDFTI